LSRCSICDSRLHYDNWHDPDQAAAREREAREREARERETRDQLEGRIDALEERVTEQAADAKELRKLLERLHDRETAAALTKDKG
jgi:uncharacterized coiled-coil protein SlyX